MENNLQLNIKKIIRETADAITLVLESESPVHYRAGQFLTLLLNIRGRDLRRSYSLSSAPGIDPWLTITIKRVENGEVSRYLIDHLQEGDVLQSLPPAGRFTLDTQTASRRDVFLVGGGSGITPLFGLLKSILKEEPESHVTLLYANHHISTTLYVQALNQLQEQYPDQFTCLYYFSNPSDPRYNLPLRLHNAYFEWLIREKLRYDRSAARFFLCGPPGLMRMAELTLVFMGFSPEQIRKENFISPILTSPLRHYHIPQAVQAKATIHYQENTYHIRIPAGENILQAALDHGLSLPYSCRGGLCSTCVAKCLKGKIHLLANEVLTDKDLNAGWILTCVGVPESSEIEIDFDQ